MPSVGGISFIHSVRYFEKGIDEAGPYYDVEYQIEDWDQSDAFANALRGIGTGTSPHRHPLSTNLACVAARVTGKGSVLLDAGGLPGYGGGALIRATYRSGGAAFGGAFSDLGHDDPLLRHQIDSSTPLIWCTQELDFSQETISLPNHQYVWASGGRANVPVQLDVAVTTMVLTFHRRSYLPTALIRAKRGRLNNALFLGAPAETVRFLGAKTTREAATDGSTEQKVQLVFQERDVSWNKFLRDDGVTWEYIQDGSGNRRYLTTDLSPLTAI
jgi:hypothetical protein